MQRATQGARDPGAPCIALIRRFRGPPGQRQRVRPRPVFARGPSYCNTDGGCRSELSSYPLSHQRRPVRLPKPSLFPIPGLCSGTRGAALRLPTAALPGVAAAAAEARPRLVRLALNTTVDASFGKRAARRACRAACTPLLIPPVVSSTYALRPRAREPLLVASRSSWAIPAPTYALWPQPGRAPPSPSQIRKHLP